MTEQQRIFGTVDNADAWATVSTDEIYRYDLGRVWDFGSDDLALWVMLNPSTADAFRDDPTIRRVRGFSRKWGHGGFVVVNLFALRATRPIHLVDHPDPFGPENVDTIRRWVADARVKRVVLAWGGALPQLLGLLGRARFDVEGEARKHGHDPVCLGRTKSRQPIHPLYVPASRNPVPA